jgi:XRE family transcriptional regulator, aerobic/anaerobic benzoate catabolism transcriptional regulator
VAVGRVVRRRRSARALTLRELAERADLSERFLVSLEAGKANISLANFADLAHALGATPQAILDEAGEVAPRASGAPGIVALVGLRGAGKTTIGAQAAERLGIAFVELDARIAERAGMPLGEVFDTHGAAHVRKLEGTELELVLRNPAPAIVATAGSLVTDHKNFDRLLGGATVVWLKASPDEHFARVASQGDARPFQKRADAMADLKSILRARRALYERAHFTIDTSKLGLSRSVERLTKIARGASTPSRAAAQS